MPSFPHHRVTDRLIRDFDPGASRLHGDLFEPDESDPPSEATLALVTDHFRFIDGQQRREIASLDSRTTWRTTTTTLMLGGFAVIMQQVVAGGALSADQRLWSQLIAIICLGYVLGLTMGSFSSLNVGRGTADDMALDAARTWERLVSLPADQVRYDMTRTLAMACINTESLLRWKRTWSRRTSAALVLQFLALAALIVVQIVWSV